ncbi:kinesin-like protein bimC [Staphylotrichum tortipilum]|uniref:Kinesin-like protein bimC n=1 Tax=Staphylotrichum tortipilum TaxID=2831512 RepID=A0AAN6MRE0_9PEZI|nr:kinesin-like protein bimC [Staphylotrichum longicolle]
MERRNTSTAPPTRGAGGRPSIQPRTRNPPTRPGVTRHAPAVPSRLTRAVSPAESVMSVSTAAGAKRKERDFDPDDGEATNINVVVRCRGRNEREVKENSTVAVKTEGTKGKIVELCMGPNAVSNKSYNFDHVFSQAADQGLLFEEVVRPVVEEMLSGYNCTIFAYGQTGTGKTYTMSGDLTESMGMLSDNAGIIPRVLQALFNKLELDDRENSVRCSFIELYNEELRDLLSSDDSAKLKIYDDTSRKGHATTVVQGMEERYILNAGDGLKWLREGSVKRQVAATKCNDLSSRSHTVFTITVYAKANSSKSETGEDFLMLGKLNLVDLAGSENIQRSGAENKRAAEAGLINKSLLTLGRVINALVDRSAHIPYRESKLTRLLQDSLGGRTKTCIIATISPARSNLEETISTLDYAFRAKNIRNKPQLNGLMNKKTLLRDFTIEIERIKAELIATRQRNGVYLSNDMYEELTVQNESRRILTEEQGAKIETLETNLRNKLQELLAVKTSFLGLQKEHDGTLAEFGETKDLLDQTETVLADTKQYLAEETHVRKAHQATEEQLAVLGGDLLGTLERTVGDIDGLHAKSARQADLHSRNRSVWGNSQAQVVDVTELVEEHIAALRQGQEAHIAGVAQRMQDFVAEEREKLASARAFLDESLAGFAEEGTQLQLQQERSREEMEGVLDEIKVVRDQVKERVGESLQAIAGAAEKIAGEVLSELGTFHGRLHASYSELGRDCKQVFEDLLRQMRAQRAEADRLRHELEAAAQAAVDANEGVAARIQEVLEEERKQAAADRQALIVQITKLVGAQAEQHESRLAGKAARIQESILDSNKTLEGSVAEYTAGMNAWGERDAKVVDEVASSRDALKTRLKDDWTTANKHSTSIQTTTKSVHAETVRAVDAQLTDLDTQMSDLDAFVARAKSHNTTQHTHHATSLRTLTTSLSQSLSSLSTDLGESTSRVDALASATEDAVEEMTDALAPLEEEVCAPLAELRERFVGGGLEEYEATGATPERTRYLFRREIPRTKRREEAAPTASAVPTRLTPSHHHGVVLPDVTLTPVRSPAREGTPSRLREVCPNLGGERESLLPMPMSVPLLKPGLGNHGAGNGGVTKTTAARGGRLPKRLGGLLVADGAENVPPAAAMRSSTRRKSPRLR